MRHYGDVLREPWLTAGVDLATRWSCLQQPPLDNGIWDIAYPAVTWNDRTVVLLHLQDFVNVDHRGVRELDMIEQHYGDLAHRVVVVHWNYTFRDTYSGALNLVYFDTHEYEIVANLAKTQHLWQPLLTQPRTGGWQCLNGVPRPHRRQVVQLLEEFAGTVSLGDEIELPKWSYHSSYRGTSNEENFMRLLPLYANHDINIVTETQYQHRPGIVTEKTFFAWLALQVPILIGYPGMIQDCRSMGFDTFDDVVDNSYDWAPNADRINLAVQLNARLLRDGIDRLALLDRLQANQQHAMVTWPAAMIQQYRQAVTEIQDSLTTA